MTDLIRLTGRSGKAVLVDAGLIATVQVIEDKSGTYTRVEFRRPTASEANAVQVMETPDDILEQIIGAQI